jgi:hypothetical protein
MPPASAAPDARIAGVAGAFQLDTEQEGERVQLGLYSIAELPSSDEFLDLR